MAQTVSQPAVYASGLKGLLYTIDNALKLRDLVYIF